MIFAKLEEPIEDLLGIKTAAEFFETFDHDGDGYLNEDDQILIFSVMKEKMHKTARDLCKIQEYEEYRELMKEVRKLERNIAYYQEEVRNRIYDNEMKTYHDIGREKVDEFYEKYIVEFEKLDKYMFDRRTQLRQQQAEESEKLNERITRDAAMVKIKPKKKLKEYQTQEVLVAIGERVEEAQNFRRELKVLEEKEKDRVNKMREDDINTKMRDMEDKHEKESQLLELKLKEMENKLKIQMSKEFQVLRKQIGLHENEIKRIQHSAANLAMSKGLHHGELKRVKDKSREQNKIIEQTKQVAKKEDPMVAAATKTDFGIHGMKSNSSFHTDGGMRSQSSHQLNRFIKSGNVINFYLRQKFGSDMPVNARDNVFRETGDQHFKIERFLTSNRKNKKDVLPKLTSFYDEHLNQLPAQTGGVDKLTQKERELRKQALDERVGWDRPFTVNPAK